MTGTALQVVTAIVFNLPVYYSSVRYAVLWGMPGPAQQTVTPDVPTYAAAIAAETNPDGSVNISIPLPVYKPQPASSPVNFGAGSSIPVELLVLPPSISASTPIATTPVTSQTLFSYDPPRITGVSVVRARFTNTSSTNDSSTDSLAVACPFAPNDPVWPCTGINTTGGPLLMVVIEVRRWLAIFVECECNEQYAMSPPSLLLQGTSLGTNPIGAPTDGVTRTLSSLVNGVWTPATNAQLFVNYAQWSSTTVVGYTFQSRGSLMVSLGYTGLSGSTTVSSSWNYSQVSPFISSLASGSGSLTGEQGGQPRVAHGAHPSRWCASLASAGFNTTGGAIITLQAANLDGSTAITVTIGGRLCSLFLADLTTNVTSSSARITQPPQQQTTNAAGDKVYTFGVMVPPGQGMDQPVVVTTYVGTAQSSSDAGFAISYAPPTLSSIVVTAADGSTSTFPVLISGTTVYAPSTGATVTFYGSNLGDAPVMYAAASTTPITLTPCPGVTDQSCYFGPAPSGEGDGLQVR